MYVITSILSDIAFARERSSQYFNDSIIYYKQVLITLLRYVRFTIDLDIVYNMKSNISKSLNSSKNFKLQAFSSFDYAVDKFNKKLILEYVFIFAGESIT